VGFALATILVLSSCSDNPTATSRGLPYLLLNADGWTLDGGTSSGPAIEAGASLGLKWTAAYRSRPEPNHEVGAALAVFDPANGAAREFVASITSGAMRQVSVRGHAAFAGEERNPDGALVASHIAWDRDHYVVALTVYETNLEIALNLAQKVAPVSQEQWERAMTASAADSSADTASG
jgi:hypothetical protein